MKLYLNSQYPNRWYAHSKEMGWVMFPAEVNGWLKRHAARGMDPMYTREVPVHMAFEAGIPGSPVPAVESSVEADDLLVAA